MIERIILLIIVLISVSIVKHMMENYKGKSSKKKEKKYLITAPSILKIGFPCACFAGGADIIFILSQIYNWEYFGQIDNTIFYLICLFILTGFMILGVVLAAYGYVWKIEFDESEIIYKSALGVTRKYKIGDITRCTEKRGKQYKFYCGKKKMFQYETDASGDVYDLIFLLKERGVFPEELIPSNKNHCIIEPMVIQKILPIIGLVTSTTFIIILVVSGSGKIWMYLVFGAMAVVAAYYTGDYLYDKTEVEDKIYRKAFLKRTKIVDFSQIKELIEYKSKSGKEYIIINVEGDNPLKIRRHNENIEFLLSRIQEERKNLSKYKKRK